MVGLTAGYLLGYGPWGLIAAMVLSAAMAFGSYWKADAIALSVSRAGPPTPRSTSACTTWSRGSASPVVSPSRASTSWTTPHRTPSPPAAIRRSRRSPSRPDCSRKLNRVELEGVVAHELSHIRNYDILVSTLAVTLVGAVAILTDVTIG